MQKIAKNPICQPTNLISQYILMMTQHSHDDPALSDVVEADNIQHKPFDRCISARVRLPQGNNWGYGIVKQGKQDADDNLVGHVNRNPPLDTSSYQVELDNGERQGFLPNIVAKHITAKSTMRVSCTTLSWRS